MDVRTVFPCDASSVGAARRMVKGELAGGIGRSAAGAELVEAASLLLSELVTNSIVHARTDIEVRLIADEHMVRAEVSDGNPTVPSTRRSHELAGTGRGLQLMEQLATRWGVSASGVGKTVWFELALAAHATG
ncbi:MAG TPA: ATP-binding protein [Acidothermaceae bacterium]